MFYFIISFYFLLRQGLTMYPSLAWCVTWYRLGWLIEIVLLMLTGLGFKGVFHHDKAQFWISETGLCHLSHNSLKLILQLRITVNFYLPFISQVLGLQVSSILHIFWHFNFEVFWKKKYACKPEVTIQHYVFLGECPTDGHFLDKYQLACSNVCADQWPRYGY